MNRVILASHAYMAKGVSTSVELILGKQENLSYISAYVEGEEPFELKLRNMLEDYKGDNIIIISDLLGGSVNNEILPLIEQYPNVKLITGMNLMLVISIIISINDNLDDEAINDIVSKSREGIIYFNDKEISDSEGLDEF